MPYSDDDDAPLSTLIKREINVPAAAVKPSAAAVVSAAVKKEAADDGEDSDDDMPLSAMNVKKKSPAPPVKRKREKDDDDEPVPSKAQKGPNKRKEQSKKPVAKPKKKPLPASKKRKAAASDEDEDDEDEDDEEDFMSVTEDEDDDDDDDVKPAKRKRPAAAKKPAPKKDAKGAKKAATSRPKRGAAGDKEKKSRTATKARGKKAVKEEDDKAATTKAILSTKAQHIEQAIKAFKWWDEEPLPQGLQWMNLEHNGIFFPPDYQPHGVKMKYNGRDVDLPSELEEVATFFASIPDDGPQLGNKDTRKIFIKNFVDEFKRMLREKLDDDLGIKEFEKCDFTAIRAHLQNLKLIKKAATVEEKKAQKAEKEARQDFYGYAIVDGRIEKVGNYNMEPPGLFRGRGKHPLMGKIKQRAMPEQVTINIGPDAKVPPCPVPGHAWDRVQHDNSVTWMACWKENIAGNFKYVMLSASSSFKGKSDKEKYDKAARLKHYIGRIRRDYESNLSKRGDKDAKQLATAMWIIDKLALRVGGEKGEDEADTVGCCSLRLEHLKFVPGKDVYEIELEFLGKDSMLFKQTIDFKSYGQNGIKVYQNLREFCHNKGPTADVFDTLNPSILNQHLSSLMPGLTAKVFRTYNASETLQNELPKAEDLEGMSVGDKVLAYNEANRKVAILCNHQRTVSKAMESTLEAMQEKLALFKEQRRELHDMVAVLKTGKSGKVKIKSNKNDDEDDALTKALADAEQKRKQAKTPVEKIAATEAIEAAKELKKKVAAAKLKEAHLFNKTPALDQVEKRLDQWTEKIKKLEVDIRNKDDNKEVALGTSKINYMDPRISVAWCKRCEVPIEKVFAKTLRDKFVWSMGVPMEWKFEGQERKR